MNRTPIITLLTDFGLSDAYVGTMKGVLLSICPTAQLVDLTHAVEPQNIRQAAYLLMTAFRHFPPDTVFLAVVDPGVGTTREPIGIETNYGVYVAPNNGVLSYVLPNVRVQHAVVLENPDYRLPGVSATFHGRDIFSPAAAHLANGVPITNLGPVLPEFVKLDDPILKLSSNQIHGEVLHIDHFGNIITSIGHLTWTEPNTLQLTPRFGSQQDHQLDLNSETCAITLGPHMLQAIRTTYGAVAPGELTALVGSSGQLEIGINQGSAARTLAVKLGDPVLLTFGS